MAYGVVRLTRSRAHERLLREGGVRGDRQVGYWLVQIGGKETLLSAVFEDFWYMLDW